LRSGFGMKNNLGGRRLRVTVNIRENRYEWGGRLGSKIFVRSRGKSQSRPADGRSKENDLGRPAHGKINARDLFRREKKNGGPESNKNHGNSRKKANFQIGIGGA